MHIDKEIKSKFFPKIDEDRILSMDINLIKLDPIVDLYRDHSTYTRILVPQEKGGSTASPFNDCNVHVLLRVKVDDQVIFDNLSPHEPDPEGNKQGFKVTEENKNGIVLDMESYSIPAVLRRTMKQAKLNETI